MNNPNRTRQLNVDEATARILAALEDLRFGAVEIQVHDSAIVRITRTEHVRVDTSTKPRVAQRE